MISHKYKCIFIHIPRTAGSSIEHWICGNDWWRIKSSTKHLLASQAKEIYKKYWNDYFKFSIIRNPWDRMVSCLKYRKFFNLKTNNNILDLSEYINTFKFNGVILEHDYRFYNIENIINDSHKSNCIYGNILDEDIDFAFKYEELKSGVEYLRKRLKIKDDFNKKTQKYNKRKSYKYYYNNENKKLINEIFQKDIEKYNYKF